MDELGRDDTGESGLSFVGAVTGATEPALLDRMRELMPAAVFLLPGVGAQGGRVEDLGAAFAPHPAAGLVTASRSIVGAHRQRGGDPARAAAERRGGAPGGRLERLTRSLRRPPSLCSESPVQEQDARSRQK